MRGLVVAAVLIGACLFAGIGLATRSAAPADVNESHRVIASTDLGDLLPVGSTVEVDCELPDQAGYLATTPVAPFSFMVVTVTAAQLDSTPHGPFTESCDHWRARRHVTTVI